MSDWPKLRTVGVSGVLVTFAAQMSEPANRAALAFRAAVDQAAWPEVRETATSLVSTYLEVDFGQTRLEAMMEKVRGLLSGTDWFAAPLPEGRTLWHVPTVYGTDLAPQLEEAAEVAGVDPDGAIAEISASRVRVLTLGFAPGQPYTGELSERWNIPRQKGLTPAVPAQSLVIAIRQLIIFTKQAPTGWRHIGQTAFHTFRPDHERPFTLAPGDELVFPSISRAAFEKLRARDDSGLGGAEREVLA